MEDNKLDLVEILKDAPIGTKLYSTIFGEVELNAVSDGMYPICIKRKSSNSYRVATTTADGKYLIEENGECTLFPSKENRDWSTFKVEPQFPMTHRECLIELNLSFRECKYRFLLGATDGFGKMVDYKDDGLHFSELNALYKLLICRDAWWKVDNDWKPDWSKANKKYIIVSNDCQYIDYCTNHILAFRTSEIRDKFFETFRGLIEECNEFL